MKSIRTFSVALFVLFGLPQLGIAQGDGATTFTLSIDGQVNFNPCTDEPVELYGDLQIVEQTALAADGVLLRHVTAAPKNLRGIGMVTGIQYIVDGPGPVFTTVLPADSASVNTVVISSHMIAPGSEDDYDLYLMIHSTVDANGELRASLSSVVSKCRG